MHPSFIPNWILRLLKWPIGVLSICALPFAVELIWLSPLKDVPIQRAQWFLSGIVGYWLAWQVVFKRRFIGSYFSTFEHEFTHAIFAWFTLHRVTGLSVTWRHGGACTYVGSGGGNWLIASGPYWFPTIVLPFLILTDASSQLQNTQVQTLLGAAVGYQITSTWRETHLGQTDLQHMGWVFSAFFLPTANVVTYGCITLWTLCSADASTEYLKSVVQQTFRWLENTI